MTKTAAKAWAAGLVGGALTMVTALLGVLAPDFAATYWTPEVQGAVQTVFVTIVVYVVANKETV